MTSKKGLIVGHIVCWLLVMALVIAPLLKFGITQPVPYAATAYVLYLGSFYINLFVIFPWWAKKRKMLPLLFSWLVLILVYTLLFLLVNYLFNAYQYQAPWLIVLNTFTRSLIFNGIFLLASMAYKFTIDWFHHKRLQEQQENERLKTELAFLRSQINPHFLFNTLSNIYTLAYQQSDKTAESVMQLSGMMQYMLYESNETLVELRKELNYIDQLIALQQLRTKAPLALRYTVSGEVDNYCIPPLLLIPFVENIFKHGVLNDDQDPALVSLAVSNDQLSLHTHNRTNGHLKDGGHGIGLSNVQRRISLLYPLSPGIRIDQSDLHFTVHLTLQLK